MRSDRVRGPCFTSRASTTVPRMRLLYRPVKGPGFGTEERLLFVDMCLKVGQRPGRARRPGRRTRQGYLLERVPLDDAGGSGRSSSRSVQSSQSSGRPS